MYFHVTTSYAILRDNGVGVGKKDYLAELLRDDSLGAPTHGRGATPPPIVSDLMHATRTPARRASDKPDASNPRGTDDA